LIEHTELLGQAPPFRKRRVFIAELKRRAEQAVGTNLACVAGRPWCFFCSIYNPATDQKLLSKPALTSMRFWFQGGRFSVRADCGGVSTTNQPSEEPVLVVDIGGGIV
jgi:hypothetical protein